ncbi:DenM|uniref:ABC-2 type transport system ATP-binding protein n=1 Tax=Dendrosporobacter quercicolus TaxID=146817 RepID=A0A1G9NZN5_9FIRM|nr:ABC transporter ATP-binding protein [Dendrosporobacter quercicolus]NSL47494.1 DenM [Dendrosporobacter quercicolus DSM 1736]SDL91811.1 ABC-2 type transport system ATP-binding protein [Dendrosporobacter quercicolus]
MYAVEINNLFRRFGGFIAVNHISLKIKQGSIYGFLGPNGSGKSTTIRMLCGLLQPTAGEGKILGLDIIRDSEAIKQKIGYMSQKFSLYDDLTVLENLKFYAGMYSLPRSTAKERIEDMLVLAGIKDRRHELAANLSGGWKQRLALSCSIIHRPSILFLDEPTGGVDPKSRRLFWDIIYQLAGQGTTVMVTTHFMDEAEHCDMIGFMFEGKLIANEAPSRLKKLIPGVLVRIDTAEPMQLLEQLEEERICCLDRYPSGAGVHILLEAHQLEQLSSYKWKRINPGLEDVFVYLVKCQREGEIT